MNRFRSLRLFALVAVCAVSASAQTLATSPNPSSFGQLVTLNAHISNSQFVTYVVFRDGGSQIAPLVPLDSNGNASTQVPFLALGTHTLTAEFCNPGCSNTSNTVNQVVKSSSTISLGSAPNPSNPGQSVTLTATLTPTVVYPGPTGSVAFYDGAGIVGMANVVSGAATLSTSALALGSHNLTASYSGDGDYFSASSGVVTQAVNQFLSTTILSTSPNPSTYSQLLTLTATVSPSAATGSVTFLDGSTAIGSATLSGGTAASTTTTLSGGSHSLTASYAGDTNDTSSQSVPVAQTINPRATATALAASPNPSAVGQTVALTATVTPAGATGYVTFFDGPNSFGVGVLSSGVATFSIAGLSAGSHNLTAAYDGDSSNSSSTSAAVNQSVAPAGSRTIASLSPATAAAGGAAFTLTVNGAGFSAGAAVQWNGAPLVTTFVTATQVTAAVPAGFLASEGAATITVVTAGGTTPGATFTVNPAGEPCSFTLPAFSASYPSAGGTGSTLVTASRTDCTWTATTVSSWITGFNTLTGSGTLNYTISPDTAGTSRMGVINIGTQSFAVTQAGTTCIDSLPVSSQVFTAAGGSGTATVEAPTGCPWTASSGATWITITPPGAGSGDGGAAYTVAANSSTTGRSATLVVAGQSYTVMQVGSSATLSCSGSVPPVPLVALEGRTEIMGDYLLNCSGLGSTLVADFELVLSTNVTNLLTNGAPDAVLTVNGVAVGVTPQVVGYNSVRWSGVSVTPAADGTAAVRISNVRADASAYATPGNLQPSTITGQLSITSLSPVPLTGALQTLANAAPSLVFTQTQPVPPAGGPQTLLPAVFVEAAAASFQASLTRLRVVLNNVPSTVQVYAPVYPSEGAARAQLYSADVNGFGGSPVAGSAFAGGQYQQLTVTQGSATATWLVLAADPAQIETWTFPLLLLNASASDLNQIQLTASLAPVSTVTTASATAPVPRYRDFSTPQPAADVHVSLHASVPPGNSVIVGSNQTSSVQLTNNSSTQAVTNGIVDGNVSTGLDLVSCTAPAGVSCSVSGSQFLVSCPTLNPGASCSATIVTQVAEATPDGTQLDTSASASSDQLTQDLLASTSSLSYVALSGTPVAVAQSPPDGEGSTQMFSFQFEDTSGYQNLGVVNVLFNNFLDGRNACYLAYVVQSSTLYLVNDAGQSGGPYAGGVPLGSSTAIHNSQCAVTLVSAAGSGTTLTLVLNIAFSSAFGGDRVVYVAARDQAQGNTNWQALGVWEVPSASPGSIAVTGVTPARGTAAAGTGQPFVLTVTDSSGTGDLGIVDVLINNFIDGRQACYLAYVASTDTLILVDDTGDAGGPYAGSMPLNGGSDSIQNGQCTVNGTGSSVASASGALTLTLNIAFKPAFAGNRVIYAAARDNAGGNNTGWQAVGTVTVQ